MPEPTTGLDLIPEAAEGLHLLPDSIAGEAQLACQLLSGQVPTLPGLEPGAYSRQEAVAANGALHHTLTVMGGMTNVNILYSTSDILLGPSEDDRADLKPHRRARSRFLPTVEAPMVKGRGEQQRAMSHFG